MSLTKDAVKKLLLAFGIEIHKKGKLQRCSLKGVLENLKANGFNPATVIDVGAAFGSWSHACAEVFPDAHYLLIEPLVEYEQALQKTIATIKNVEFLPVGISDTNIETTIYVHPDLVGSSLKKEHEPHNQASCRERKISCKTLDSICLEKNPLAPYLIKLDIQGMEREALSGCGETLKSTEALILEVSLIECINGAGRLDEIIHVLSTRGFVVYDLFGNNYRPYDHALAQVDILFVPESSSLRSVKWYASEKQRNEMNKKFQEQRLTSSLHSSCNKKTTFYARQT